MSNLKDFFSVAPTTSSKGVLRKNNIIKRNIVAYMALCSECTLSELTKELHVSVPTITKLVQELVEEKIIVDLGKVETPGGRRPNIFGLTSSALYFVGVSVERGAIVYVVADLHNSVIAQSRDDSFELADSPECLDAICAGIEGFIDGCGVDRGRVMGVGVSITGRVNPEAGRSYRYFTSSERSVRDIIEARVGIRVLLENDTRARCYAEYSNSDGTQGRNVLYLHLGLGVAIGIVVDGKLYYGHSGFAGEFGHIPFFDNDVICACGKKGCLETEVAGVAIEQKMMRKIGEGVNSVLSGCKRVAIGDIIAAAKGGDNLSIELIEEVGKKVGKALAFLINIFNPESVVVGGVISEAGDCVMLPMLSEVNKHSLGLVYKDTQFRLSTMGDEANALGVAMLIRNKVLGL